MERGAKWPDTHTSTGRVETTGAVFLQTTTTGQISHFLHMAVQINQSRCRLESCTHCTHNGSHGYMYGEGDFTPGSAGDYDRRAGGRVSAASTAASASSAASVAAFAT